MIPGHIQITDLLGLFQTSEGTLKSQATMHIFLFLQLKSPLIIRYFLFGSWNLAYSPESHASKHN